MLEGNVEHRHYIEADIYRETPEVSGPRGWGESSVTSVKFEIEYEGLIMTMGGERYLVPEEVLRAALALVVQKGER